MCVIKINLRLLRWVPKNLSTLKVPISENIVTPDMTIDTIHSEDEGVWVPATKVTRSPIVRDNPTIQISSFALFQQKGLEASSWRGLLSLVE